MSEVDHLHMVAALRRHERRTLAHGWPTSVIVSGSVSPSGRGRAGSHGDLVHGQYPCTTFAWVALIWHLATLAVLYLVVRYGNRYRRALAAYFALNYAWLVAFVGI